MALDGINYFVSLNQIKVSNANEAGISESQRPSQKRTGFDAYFQEIGVKRNGSQRMTIKTDIKAGGIWQNHNETMVSKSSSRQG